MDVELDELYMIPQRTELRKEMKVTRRQISTQHKKDFLTMSAL